MSLSLLYWRQSKTLTADTGVFVVGGATPTLQSTHFLRLLGNTAIYALSPAAATLRAARIPFAAGTGAYTLSGSAPHIYKPKLACSTVAYVLAANAPSLSFSSRKLVAATGAYTLSGAAATLVDTYPIAPATGAFSMAFYDVGLRYSNHPKMVGTGSFAAAGGSVALTYAPLNPNVNPPTDSPAIRGSGHPVDNTYHPLPDSYWETRADYLRNNVRQAKRKGKIRRRLIAVKNPRDMDEAELAAFIQNDKQWQAFSNPSPKR